MDETKNKAQQTPPVSPFASELADASSDGIFRHDVGPGYDVGVYADTPENRGEPVPVATAKDEG